MSQKADPVQDEHKSSSDHKLSNYAQLIQKKYMENLDKSRHS